MIRSALFLTLVALASPALAFTARNGVGVIGNADQIEVQPSAGQAAPQSWCAAGDFVMRALGLPGDTPIYRISPPPRRSGQGVIFSLSPEGAADRSGLISLFPKGAEVSAGHARSLCGAGRYPT